MKLFSCCENNLAELPFSLVELDPNGFLDAETNPLYSPPPGLMSEKLSVVQNYLGVRLVRLNELEELLEEEDFGFIREYATPFASEVLSEGTGFLLPNDLSEFDRAVDNYINGDFFKCPASGYEIVEKLSNLRDLREHALYSAVLQTLLTVLTALTTEDPSAFGPAVYMTTTRPWGRKGEKTPCHVISLTSLLKDAPKSVYHKDGRVSVVKFLEAALPPMPFPFSVDLLKDALKLFSSPFGQVAEIEELDFAKCDCIDEKKNKPSRHMPCRKPAVVVLQTIYTDEEAQRREEEDATFIDIFEEIEAFIREWISSDVGRKILLQVCKIRRKDLFEEISLREGKLLLIYICNFHV